MIYLDHAATTTLRPAAQAALVQALGAQVGNPSAMHQAGQAARLVVETARRHVADLLSVRPEAVVFTSSGTEANNLALRGIMHANPTKRLLVGATEHHCVLETAKALAQQGIAVEILPVGTAGYVEPTTLATALAEGDVALVSLLWVNNETGIISPVAAYFQLCQQHGARYHTDAVQGVGHVPLPAEQWFDLATLSAHKIGGAVGAGALVIQGHIPMLAQHTGGGQERNRRAGTENTPALAAFGAAAAELATTQTAEIAHYVSLKELLLQKLPQANLPSRVVGANTATAPHIVRLVTPNLPSEDALIALDLAGIAASQGSACSSGRNEPSKVLQAMGYSAADAACALRISFGPTTTGQEVELFMQRLEKLCAQK